MAINRDQLGVLRGMTTGAAISALGLAWGLATNPFDLAGQVSLDHRLELGLAADLGLALWLAVSIGWMARLRFVSSADLHGSGVGVATPRARILQAVLQNSLEQIGLAVLVHLLWIVLMPAAWLAAVPVASGLCLVGRIGFGWGYGKGAAQRSLGFALSFYPSLFMLLLMVAVLLIRRLPGGW